MDPEVIRDLEAAYHRHFEGEEPRPGQVALSGLKSYRPSDQEEFLSGLKETTRHTIDKWAETVLKNAEDFTGAALEIKTVTLGYGFSANRGEGPLIHVDSDTFLHGLTTLRGQSAIIFPRGRAYRFYSLALESQEQPKVLLKKFPENGSGVPLVLKDGIQFGPGQTVLISGTEFERDYIGAKGTWHSSPAEVAPNRLSLFVAIRKRALSK